VRGDPLGDPRDELAGVQRAAGDHVGHRDLAGLLVRPRDDGGVGHLRMPGQERFQLGRGDLEGVDLDQLLEPVDHEQVAARVDAAEVAGAEPAGGVEHLRGRLGPAEVAGH
jgi:hypothetical protein